LLLQVLDRLPDDGAHNLVLVGQGEFRGVSDVGPEELAALGHNSPPVTREQHALARFCELARGTPALPAIGQALHRLLQEYPSTVSGLSRTERQLLEASAGLSERGRAVLAGREMWSPEGERWIGGVRLPPGAAPWRWDPAAETVV
jgi:hypothetical protein